jgi:hypothetical protein
MEESAKAQARRIHPTDSTRREALRWQKHVLLRFTAIRDRNLQMLAKAGLLTVDFVVLFSRYYETLFIQAILAVLAKAGDKLQLTNKLPWGYTGGELTGGAYNNAAFGVPLGESVARVMGSNLSDLAKAWVTTDLHVQDFHSGSFGKTNQQQEEALQKGHLASLSSKEKEEMMRGHEKGGLHSGQFGKTNQQQEEALQKGRLASLSVNEKKKMMTGFLNASAFGHKGSIAEHVARTLARVDISEEKKLDLTTKVKRRGLTTLGANIQLESATSEGEIRAATGQIALWEAKAGSLPHNDLLVRMDGLWKQVVKIEPAISWIDESSTDEGTKESWWLKEWTAGETLNPPKCWQWARKLGKKEVTARIAHYVKSKAPQARHAMLRELLPLLASAMAAYTTAKNRKSKATWKAKHFK